MTTQKEIILSILNFEQGHEEKNIIVESNNGNIKIYKMKITEQQKEDIISINDIKVVDDLFLLKEEDFLKVKGIGKIKARNIHFWLQENQKEYERFFIQNTNFKEYEIWK